MANNLLSRLGIQSWCFRKFTTTQQVIDGLRACGVDHLEICGVHGNAEKDPEALKVIDEYRKAGISLSSTGVWGIGRDEAGSRRVFEFAKKAGITAISASVWHDWLPLAEKLSAEYGIKLALHNHGRHDFLVNIGFLEKYLAKASRNIGVCLDTAWMMDGGDDAMEAAKKFQDRLYGLHLKDFIFDRAGKPHDVVLGDGNLDIDGLMKFLVQIDYKGYLTIEYEGDADNPVPALKKCVERVRRAYDRAVA